MPDDGIPPYITRPVDEQDILRLWEIYGPQPDEAIVERSLHEWDFLRLLSFAAKVLGVRLPSPD